MVHDDYPDPIVAAIRGLLEVDPLKALGELIRAEHRARLQNRGEAHRIGLRTLRAEILARRTDLLRQFSQHCQSHAVLVATDRPLPLADLSAALSAPPGVEFPPVDQVEAESLQRRLDNKQENLRLIQERITEFVLTTDIPLQYIQQERTCIADIRELEQQLGQPAGAHDEPELREGPAQELLSLVALFRGVPLGEHLAAIRLIAVDSAVATSPAETQIVRATCWLWDNFNQTVRTLVVNIFDWIRHQKNSALEEQVKQAFSANPKMRRLSMDATLRDWPTIQQFAAVDYHWPARIKHANTDRPGVTKFLADTGLKTNPFQPGAAQFDPLLLVAYAVPLRADEISRPRPMLLVSQELQDRASLRLLLGSQDRQIGLPQCLPALCELTDEFKTAPQPVAAYLDLIAHGAAWSWLEFLPLNVAVWFDLLPRQQRSLVDLLAWHAQSKQRPIDQLYLNGLSEDSEAQAVKEEMAALFEKVTPTGRPHEVELLRWLEARPPFLDHTYALLDCPFTASQEIQIALSHLIEVSNRLLEANVILKVFVAEWPIPGDDLDIVPIEWDERTLTQMLNDRIRLTAERGYNAFTDLFYPNDPDGKATTELIRAAGGSLGRLQRLGQQIIMAHVYAGLTVWDVEKLLTALHDHH